MEVFRGTKSSGLPEHVAFDPRLLIANRHGGGNDVQNVK